MPGLAIDIEGRFAQFLDGMNQIQKSGERAAKSLEAGFRQVENAVKTIAAALAVREIAGFVQASIDLSDSLNDLSTRTGMTAQQLLTLREAAERGGGSLESLDTLASKIPKVLKEAGDASSYTARAIKALGVDPKKGLTDLYGYLLDVGEGLSGFEDNAKKTALAIAALGKGGDKLIPVVEALRDTEETMKRLGITIGKDTLAAADKFNDTMRDVKTVGEANARSMAAGLLPALQRLAELFTEVSKAQDTFKGIGKAVGDELIDVTSWAMRAAFEIKEFGKEIQYFGEWAKLAFTGKFDAALSLSQKRMEDFGAARKKLFDDIEKLRSAPESESTPTKQKKDAPDVPSDEALKQQKTYEDAQKKLQDFLTKVTVDAEKARADASLKILDARYKEGLLSDAEYYAQKEQIATAALTAELALLDKQAARQTEAFRKEQAGTKEQVEAYKDLNETLAKREALLSAAGTNRQLDDLAAARAAKEYANALRGVNASILDLEGNSAEASIIRFGLQIEELYEKASKAGDEAAQKQIRRYINLNAAQAEYQKLQQQSGVIEQNLAAEEQRIRNAQEVGAINELEAMRQIQSARETAVPQLTAIADAMRAIPGLPPKVLAELGQFEVKVQSVGASADLFAQKVATTLQESAANAFVDFITGSKSASDAFKDFARSVLTELARMEAKLLASKIFAKTGGVTQLLTGFLQSALGGGASTTPTHSGTEELGGMIGMTDVVATKSSGSVAPVTVNNYIDSRTDQAQIAQIASQSTKSAVAEVFDRQRRGNWQPA